MPHLMLSWQYALAAAVGLAIAATAIRLSRQAARRAGHEGAWRRWDLWGGVTLESALLFGLYALWQFAGSFTVMGKSGALPRARWLWDAEHWLHLPSEAATQRPLLPHPLLIQACNLYYDILHFPVLGACLIWLYARHRGSYPQVRTTVALFTGISLLIQLIPVAPPRLLPLTGMVDTAVRFGQSVYAWNGGFDADEFSAMPSVHIGWALIVAIAVITVSRSRWRWLAAAYPVVTLLVVVVTANHFWLDGIVAALLVVLVLVVQRMAGGLRSGNSSEGAQDEAYSRRGVAAARVRERPRGLDREYGDLEQSEAGAQPGRSPDAAVAGRRDRTDISVADK